MLFCCSPCCCYRNRPQASLHSSQKLSWYDMLYAMCALCWLKRFLSADKDAEKSSLYTFTYVTDLYFRTMTEHIFGCLFSATLACFWSCLLPDSISNFRWWWVDRKYCKLCVYLKLNLDGALQATYVKLHSGYSNKY